MTLWHYTCDHGYERIVAERPGPMLRPHPRLGLLWLTDLDAPARRALGLTSYSLHCDRTAHRFRVPNPQRVQAWTEIRRNFDPGVRAMLEDAPGAMPRHWYVSFLPQFAEYRPR